MIKKILLLAAVAVTSSFATWDYFGIPQNSQGSIKGGIYYDKDDDWSQMGLQVGARIKIAPNFELSLQNFGYQFWGESECDENTPKCNSYAEGGDGLRDLVIGGRYALTPMVNLFLDFNLPIGRDKYDGNGTTAPSNDEIYFYFGAQIHNDIKSIKGAEFGAEGGLFWGLRHHDKERGLEARFGGEFDYTLPTAPVTVLVGGQFWLRVFRSEYDNGVKSNAKLHDDFSTQFKIWFGANFALTDQVSLNGQIIARSQNLKKKAVDGTAIGMEGDAIGFRLDMEFSF